MSAENRIREGRREAGVDGLPGAGFEHCRSFR